MELYEWGALRRASDRLDLGPNGPKVIVNVAMVLGFIVVMLLMAPRFWEARGPGFWWLFPVLFVGQFVVWIVRALHGARADLEDGWRD